jgi:hypothetical protein
MLDRPTGAVYAPLPGSACSMAGVGPRHRLTPAYVPTSTALARSRRRPLRIGKPRHERRELSTELSNNLRVPSSMIHRLWQ